MTLNSADRAGKLQNLGVGKDEAARGALFLVFYPEWARPGPGILLN